MLQNFQSAVKARFIAVLLIVHAGLALGIHALGRMSATQGWDETSILLLISGLFLYGGFVLALLFVTWGLMPWVQGARKVEHWSERLMRDVPMLVDQLPKLVVTAQALQQAWRESKAPAVVIP